MKRPRFPRGSFGATLARRQMHTMLVTTGLLLAASVGLWIARWPRLFVADTSISWLAPLVLLLTLACLWEAIRVGRDPQRSIPFQQIRALGADPLAVAAEVDALRAVGGATEVHGIVFTPRWMLSHEFALPLGEIVWVYGVETSHSVNFIPVAKTSKLTIYAARGKYAKLPLTIGLGASDVEAALRRLAPWARFGYDSKLESELPRAMRKLAAEAAARRDATSGDAMPAA